MKKILILTFSLLVLSAQGQKLKDKINEKANALADKASGNTGPVSAGATAPLTANQYEMIEPFSKAAKLWITNMTNGVAESPVFFEPTNFMKEFERNDKGIVTSFNSGGTMSPDFGEFPKSFLDYHRDKQIFFIQGYCFILNVYKSPIKTAEDVEKTITNDKVFERILCLGKEDAKTLTLVKAKDLIKNYLTEVQKGIDAINASKANAEAELRAKFSIKDKKLKSLAIESSNETISYKESVNYTIIATLEDGSIIKAGEGGQGFKDDYLIEVTGMIGGDATSLYNGFYATPTDKITLKVTSKYHLGKTASKVFKMKYEIVEFTGPGLFKFSSQAGQSPYNGISSRVEIKQVKNSNTGETMMEYRLFNMSGTKPEFAFKCKPETNVDFNIGARNHVSEVDGVGKNGYDGGDLKIIIDPSVTEAYNFTYSVKGARGQRGKAGDGKPGRDGKVETVKQKVTW